MTSTKAEWLRGATSESRRPVRDGRAVGSWLTLLPMVMYSNSQYANGTTKTINKMLDNECHSCFIPCFVRNHLLCAPMRATGKVAVSGEDFPNLAWCSALLRVTGKVTTMLYKLVEEPKVNESVNDTLDVTSKAGWAEERLLQV